MVTLLKTSRLHWNALSCESVCPSSCMHQFRRICHSVSGRHLVQCRHVFSDMLICFISQPHSMLPGPYACMHACICAQQDSVQQGEHLAFLQGTVTDISISMHICVAPEVVCKSLCGLQPVTVLRVHMQRGQHMCCHGQLAMTGPHLMRSAAMLLHSECTLSLLCSLI